MTATATDERDAAAESRDKTATRLLGSSSQELLRPAAGHRLGRAGRRRAWTFTCRSSGSSLYGTALWDGMSHEQRVELSRQELASVAEHRAVVRDHPDPDAGALRLPPGSAGRAHPVRAHRDRRRDPAHHHVREGDRPAGRARPTGRTGSCTTWPGMYKATARGTALFAPVLVAEEVTDRLQRATMNDESIHPLVRMVNRIHVIEEARHVRFAREEVARLMPTDRARSRS